MTADTVPASPTVRPLDPALDAAAALILAAATFAGTAEAGAAVLAAARQGLAMDVFGLFTGGELAGVYILHRVGLTNEISHLAIAPAHRHQGHGRMCLMDAGLRSGRRPLVVETDDAALGFYRARGFKLVSKRRKPGSEPRYRLGWHAPTARPANGPGAGGASDGGTNG